MAIHPTSPMPMAHALDGVRVCVTGGAGFIGSHLVAALFDAGALVTVIDDLSSSTSDRLVGLIEVAAPGRARFIHASILEPGALAEAVADARIVFHLAAMASAVQAQEEPVRCVEVNGLGTARVAQASCEAGATRLVYAASASAYGEMDGPNRESQAPAPLSPYAAGKLAGEHVVTAWARSRGLDGANLRLFNVYGEGQSPESEYAAVIPAFAARLGANTPPVVYGDGAQTRDFVHVRDVARAFLLAGCAEGALEGATMNIGSGRSVSIAQLASLMARLCGADGLEPTFEPARSGDIRASECNPARAAERLAFQAEISLEEGLEALLDGCRGRSRAAV